MQLRFLRSQVANGGGVYTPATETRSRIETIARMNGWLKVIELYSRVFSCVVMELIETTDK